MKILVVGSGGREHALVWKIAQSKRVKKIFCAPGNAGIAQLAECVDISADNIDKLLAFAKDNKIDLTVVGPEVPLVVGIVDEFQKNNLKIFGPNKELANLEGSKIFAKEQMRKFAVPTADFEVFNNMQKALDYLDKKNIASVVKADGLAAGKGVFVCKDKKEAAGAIKIIMQDKSFGNAGEKIIIEDCLEGEEASILVITDGQTILPLASSQDHKRIFDNDKGPNTGGMGAYSPAPIVSDKLFKEIQEKVFQPLIFGLSKEGKKFNGLLYAGLMITKNGPKVLEFNVRFGDPETQAILPRLKSDLVEIFEAAIEGKLKDTRLNWDSRVCVSVVLASGGYPGDYQKGKEISGLDKVNKLKDVVIFHAGTLKKDSKILTNGGRVLNISALASTIKEAQAKAYEAVKLINFEEMYYRKDIGYRAIK